MCQTEGRIYHIQNVGGADCFEGVDGQQTESDLLHVYINFGLNPANLPHLFIATRQHISGST